jgi:hypothetical protein
MRYTIKNLTAHVAKLNEDLDQAGKPRRLVIQQFNDTTWLYYATPTQIAEYCTGGMIDAGTPRELSQVASTWTRLEMAHK